MIDKQASKLERIGDYDYSDILESVSDGVMVLDGEWNITYVNKGAQRIFMKSMEQMISKHVWKLFPNAVGSQLYKEFNRAVEDNTPIHFQHHGLVTGKVYDVHAYPLRKGLSIYFVEVTEWEQMKETVKELAAIVESSNDAIISGTLNGTIVNWNLGATHTYGYSVEEAVDKPIFILFPLENRHRVNKILDEISVGRDVKNIEIVQVRKDNKTINVLVSAFPIRTSDNKVKGFSMIARDITEFTNMKQEMAKLDRLNLIGQMAAGIAHEIRNPMTTVKGFLQVLSQNKEYYKEQECFELMIEEIDRANGIISEFLSLGQTKSIGLEYRNLNNILNALHPLFLAEAVNHEIQVRLELDEIPNIFVDEKEIRQLIHNLVRNGLEAMISGGVLSIRTFKEGHEVVLAVEDQGSGINVDLLNKLGTPFFTTKDHGTGLGLAVCYSIARRYNAKIDIKTSDKGTTFFVRFKL